MSSDPVIREALEADAKELQRYTAEVLAERLPTVLGFAKPPTVEEERKFLGRCIQSPNSVVLIAELDGELVGMLDFHGHMEPQWRHAGVFGMSTAKSRRGQGIGTALIEALLRWAPSHGVTRIELEVLGNNLGAIRLYECLGFEHEGCRRGAIVVAEKSVDVILMAKLLAG